MLSWFVHLYVDANALTPDAILVLFIVTVLAAVWAVATLFTYHRTKGNSRFVAIVDLCFVGAFIAGVYTLRFIGGDDCTHLTSTSYSASFGLLGSITYGGYGIAVDKTCAMLKASWAFGIMNCIFFFITSMLAFMVGGSHKKEVQETHYSRTSGRRPSSRHSRHSHSSHSGGRHVYV
jgi:hypothetical protein